MHSVHQQILPASGIEFATSLNLTPSTQESNPARHDSVSRVVCNLVVARSSFLRIFEVVEEPAPVIHDEERDRKSTVRRGTEPVEGEVEMDEQGDGYINIAKSVTQRPPPHTPTVTRLYLIRKHQLHGIVTGLQSVRTVASQQDNLDRLLISFKDAKVAVLEWSDSIYDLITVSIHTYERAPQLLALESPLFRAELRCDPLSRCSALSLPKHTLAILPFIQTQVELEVMDQDFSQQRDIPYSPSFILDLPAQVDPNLQNIMDFVFLPGFNNPTLAMLFQTQLTWTGRLKEYRDTAKIVIFTLDIAAQHYPILTFVDNLPHDSMYLLPCPVSLGGVVVVTGNTIIYVDQSSRRIVLPVNGWNSRISDVSAVVADPTQKMTLEGSRSIFMDERTFFLVLRDGTVYPVDLIVDGKTVSKLTVLPPLARTSIPSIARKIGKDHIFIGSTVGPSVLLKAARVEEEIKGDENEQVSTAVVRAEDSMEYEDEDEDIYGVSYTNSPVPNGSARAESSAKKTKTVIRLSLKDFIPGHGPIADMSFSLAKNGDRFVPELVAATGYGSTGGFTLFQRDLPVLTKRKIHHIGGARGLWSLPIRQHVKASGISYEKPMNPFQEDHDTLILSTDINPSPGLSRIGTKGPKGEVSIPSRIPGTTIGAGPFFQRTAIIHVMTNAIRILEPDGGERQIIKDMDGNMPRPKIRGCSLSDPFVFVVREDDSIGLFIGETERGKIRRKDMSPMGDKASRYLTGCFYTDSNGFLERNYDNTVSPTSPTSTLQAAVNAGSHSQWLVLVRPQGIMEIWTLPKLTLAFSTGGLSTLQSVLVDSHDPPALSLPKEVPRKPQDLDVEQLLMVPIGETSPRPYLCVFLRSGQLTIYQIVPAGQPLEPLEKFRPSHLNIQFVKVASIAFEIQRQEENNEKSIIAEQKRISRNFIPFVTKPSPNTTYSGVFLTGDRPHWILASNKNGVHIYPSGHSIVHAFTACSLWESPGDFLLYTEEGPSLLEWIPDFRLDGPLPNRFIPRGRGYSNILFDASTGLIVAGSSLQAKFASYDEDGNRTWEPDALNITDPVTNCSTLELISPDHWITLDGYEFSTNEFINDITSVSLETASTESGTKDFIVVGTTIDRGEDLATKGATYIFEIVEVVSDASILPQRWYRLRMRCRDDAKGPVTAVCGFAGYVVSSMGQKIFVRAFDSDERLVGVAFMDVGVYVTSLRALKNLLLVGDAVKSVMFVAFQEDPYKLTLIAKDLKRIPTAAVDFFFTSEDLGFVSVDDEGVIRVYEYNPQDPDSNNGRYLLLRTEFHSQSEFRTTSMIARRTRGNLDIPQSKLLLGSPDGSLSSLTPVEEGAFKRLQLLQGQLTRNIQHVSGLNPKAFRIVRNDYISKPLSKGILDGTLLAEYEFLPITRQNEMTRQIGTERTVVLRDWISLSGPW